MKTDPQAATPESPLAGQVDHWMTHQHYPKFAGLGIFDPAEYWRIQTILDEGPEAWQRESELLRGLEQEPQADFPGLPDALLETLAAPFRPVLETLPVKPCQNALDVLSLAHFFLQPFFQAMHDGLDAAVVYLAEDYQGEKPSRRFGWHRDALYFAVESPEDRMAVLRRATAPGCPAALRRRAMRWLPACLPANQELFHFLAGFGQEQDPLLKYLAAGHLRSVVLFGADAAGPDWVCEALWHGLTGVGFAMGCYEDEVDLSARTAHLLEGMGSGVLRRTVAFLESRQPHHPPAWWNILAWLFIRREEEFLRSLRERWQAALTPSQSEALDRFLRKLQAMKDSMAEGDPQVTGESYPFSGKSPTMVDGLTDPRCYLKRLPPMLGAELDRQEALPGADRSRLARARRHLQEGTLAGEEPETRSFFALVNAAIPFALVDHLLAHGDEAGPAGLIESMGSWNTHR